MYYVYIIRSVSQSEQIYIGATADLKKRFEKHNLGQVNHTSKFMPWELLTYTAFKDKDKAYEYEKYLKSHSGRAFLRKRLV